ncbi:V-type ATP synthase subunit D [Thiohalorhabdus sp.]|uniref:V-type ATP synthase subunit D n=1 Tax=Thiohalorhabdus sp. TaxID=3094134 RepID=UPI002FC2FB5B
MAEDYSDRPVSRATLMEIQADREVIEEGYDFLDEKLVLLAQELLQRIKAYQQHRQRFRDKQAAAYDALAMAIRRHGLEGLQLYPPRPLETVKLHWRRRDFLGVSLIESAQLESQQGSEGSEAPPRPSAEARDCAARFAELAADGAALAAEAANLRRLLAEYEKTQQRARALDNVILPEVREAERSMGERLEEAEQEEAVRIRLFAPGYSAS